MPPLEVATEKDVINTFMRLIRKTQNRSLTKLQDDLKAFNLIFKSPDYEPGTTLARKYPARVIASENVLVTVKDKKYFVKVNLSRVPKASGGGYISYVSFGETEQVE